MPEVAALTDDEFEDALETTRAWIAHAAGIRAADRRCANGELVTDSRAVARAFQKQHKNLLQSIDAMRDSKVPEIVAHHRANFRPMIFPVQIGKGGVRNVPGYQMTYDGLSELAMGLTGDKARLLRIRFLAAFGDVNERLRNVTIGSTLSTWSFR